MAETYTSGKAVMESRSEARARGQRWYFTGLPCPRGHVAKRSVSNRECRGCVNDRQRRYRSENPEPFREREKQRRDRDPAAYAKLQRDRRVRHIEKRRAYDNARYLDPERMADAKRRAVQWSRDNKGKRAAIIAARRAAQKQATPLWLTDEQKEQIRAFYIEAAARPGEWHVDHIYPIKGKNSCGLHVPWNLQIITGDENRRKGNRIDGAE